MYHYLNSLGMSIFCNVLTSDLDVFKNECENVLGVRNVCSRNHGEKFDDARFKY